MTIVLQHQYWDLAPGETFFAVTLKFGGQPKKLSVPYAAVTRFYDPSVQFLLQFEAPEAEVFGAGSSTPEMLQTRPRKSQPTPVQDPEQDQPEVAEAEEAGAGDEPKIVSLDQFRKK
jgi:hypothetical protein